MSVEHLLGFDPLRAAIDDYLLAITSQGLSAKTVSNYRNALNRLHRFAGAGEPSRLSPTLLRAWLAAMAVEGLDATSRRDYLRYAKTWIKWLAEEGCYGVDQQQQQQCRGRVKPPPEEYDPIAPFTDEEIRALLKACNPNGWMGQRTKAIVALLLDTGLRASELCGLTLADVDLAEGLVTVRATTSKGRRGRTVALGRRARREMGQWWARKRHLWDTVSDSPWFVGRTERALVPERLYSLLTRHGKRAGVSDAHPHRFRHTAAINALKAGMTPIAVMRMLGHSDLSMTQRYIRYLDADVHVEKRQHSPLDRLKL